MFVVGFCFTACKKKSNNIPDPSGKTYTVTFNTVGTPGRILISSPKTAVNAVQTDTPASAVATMLYYVVTDTVHTNKTIYRTISQDSTTAGFGHIVDHLPAGNYLVNIFAGQHGLTEISGQLTYNGLKNASWEDTFYTQVPLTVTNSDITQNVSLSRLVAELEVNINDAIPANAHTFALTFTYEYQYYYFTTSAPYLNGYAFTYTNTIPASAVGQKNYQFSTIILNTSSPAVVHLVCYDANLNKLSDKTINNITLQKNTRTILSGNMFSGNNNVGVTANSDWDLTPFKTINY